MSIKNSSNVRLGLPGSLSRSKLFRLVFRWSFLLRQKPRYVSSTLEIIHGLVETRPHQFLRKSLQTKAKVTTVSNMCVWAGQGLSRSFNQASKSQIRAETGLRKKSFMPYRVTFIRAIKRLTIFRKNLGLFVRWVPKLKPGLWARAPAHYRSTQNHFPAAKGRCRLEFKIRLLSQVFKYARL